MTSTIKKLLAALMAAALLLTSSVLAEGDPNAVIAADAVEDAVGEAVAAMGEADECNLSEADMSDAGPSVAAADPSEADAPLFEAVATDFPDANFWNYLTANFDADADQVLSDAEIANITEINVSNTNIVDLTGIEKLTGLESLWCSNTGVTRLDLTHNPALRELVCDDCALVELKLGEKPNLVWINSFGHILSELDLSGCTALEELRLCSGQDAPLSSLDLSKCTSLRILLCTYHDNLTALDVSKLTHLEELECYGNALTSLDVSHNLVLRDLNCHQNKLTALDVSHNTKLTNLCALLNPLTTLDISNCPTLVSVVDVDKNPPRYSDTYFTEIYNWTDTVAYEYWFVDENGYDQRYTLSCNSDVLIVGGNPAAPVPKRTPGSSTGDTGNTPGDTTGTESESSTIAATGKTNRVTIHSRPGRAYLLDLGGATGKGFKSSKKKVAIVNGTGQVTIKGAGKTKITFKVGKKKRTVNLTVIDPTLPTSVTLNMAGTNAASAGDTVQLTATLSEGAESAIKWKSSNRKVATVDQNGLVTFRKAGKKAVTITATAVRGKKKASVKFKVN